MDVTKAEVLWNHLEQTTSTLAWARLVGDDGVVVLRKKTCGTGLKYLYYDVAWTKTSVSSTTLLPSPQERTVFSPSRCSAVQFNTERRTSLLSTPSSGLTKDPQRIDVWNLKTGHLRSFEIPEKLHRGVMTAEFGGVTFSPCSERYLMYAAEAWRERSGGYLSSEALQRRGERFVFEQNWGEKHKGESLGRLFIADLVMGRVLAVAWSGDPDVSLGQPVWLPDGKGFAVTAWPTTPWRLGTVYCQNRYTRVYLCTFAKPLDVYFTSNTSEMASIALDRCLQVTAATTDGDIAAMHSPMLIGDASQWALVVQGIQTRNVRQTLFDVEGQAQMGPHWSSVCLLGTNRTTTAELTRKSSMDDNLTVSVKCHGAGLVFELSRSRETLLTLPYGCLLSNVVGTDVRDEALQLRYFDFEADTLIDVPRVALPDEGICRVQDIRQTDATHIDVLYSHSSPTCSPSLYIAKVHLSLDSKELLDWKPVRTQELPTSISTTWSSVASPHRYFYCCPTDPDATKGIVVVLHGGPNSISLPEFSLPVMFLLQMGYTLFVPNYTGSLGRTDDGIHQLGGHIGTVDVNDILSAFQHFKDTRNLNSCKNVYLVGGSHGGYLSLMLAAKHPECFRAVSVRNPVTNLYFNLIANWALYNGLNIMSRPDMPGTHHVTADELKALNACSPVSLCEKVQAPVLLALGEDDMRVPPSQGLDYFRRLQAAHPDRGHRLLWYPSNGHAIDHPECNADYWVNTALWFEEHRKV